jgi:hypothetical protein
MSMAPRQPQQLTTTPWPRPRPHAHMKPIAASPAKDHSECRSASVQTPNPPFRLRARISSACSSCCRQRPSQRACLRDRGRPHPRALPIRSTHGKTSPNIASTSILLRPCLHGWLRMASPSSRSPARARRNTLAQRKEDRGAPPLCRPTHGYTPNCPLNASHRRCRGGR